MEIGKGDLGPESSYDVSIDGGKIHLEVKYAGADAAASLVFDLDGKPLVAALAAKIKSAIPGQIDDLVIDMLVAALLK